MVVCVLCFCTWACKCKTSRKYSKHHIMWTFNDIRYWNCYEECVSIYVWKEEISCISSLLMLTWQQDCGELSLPPPGSLLRGLTVSIRVTAANEADPGKTFVILSQLRVAWTDWIACLSRFDRLSSPISVRISLHFVVDHPVILRAKNGFKPARR